MVNFKHILEAKKRISPYIYRTPLEKSLYLSNSQREYYLKLESQQKVNSFKIRGALSKMTSLTEVEKKKGIMAVSSGNHGAAVSYGASLLGGIDVTIFVPQGTPRAKIDKMSSYGANVRIEGKDYNETHRIAMEFLEKDDLTLVDPCSDVEVIAGQGTMALEIIEDLPDLDAILVPIGGGGMITGISVAAKQLKPHIKIIGLQTEACPAMIASLKDNVFYEEYPIKPSICDALVGGVGEIPFKMASSYIDDIIEVKEESIRKAVPYIINQEKTIAEPSSAIGYAAVMDNPSLIQRGKAVIIISGGNIDGNTLKNLINTEFY